MNQINRRSFVAGAAFGVAGTVVAAPLAAPLAKPVATSSVSDEELIALFSKLSRKRQEEILRSLWGSTVERQS